MIKRILSLLFMLAYVAGSAQTPQPEMADEFRQDGKIYVVISVLAMIFVALVIYLVMLDRKIKKLEEKIKDPNA